jgi:hypothetical protein
VLAADQQAKGLVASIREVVNQKDAFTRMNNAREEERQTASLSHSGSQQKNVIAVTESRMPSRVYIAIVWHYCDCTGTRKIAGDGSQQSFKPMVFSFVNPFIWLVRLVKGSSSRLMGSLNSVVFCISLK